MVEGYSGDDLICHETQELQSGQRSVLVGTGADPKLVSDDQRSSMIRKIQVPTRILHTTVPLSATSSVCNPVRIHLMMMTLCCQSD